MISNTIFQNDRTARSDGHLSTRENKLQGPQVQDQCELHMQTLLCVGLSKPQSQQSNKWSM